MSLYHAVCVIMPRTWNNHKATLSVYNARGKWETYAEPRCGPFRKLDGKRLTGKHKNGKTLSIG